MSTATKSYGIKIKHRPAPTPPAALSLQGDAGERVTLAAAKRVFTAHKKVIKALADR
ncbi:hypothetical protein EV683_12728 [Crenobacter luteus]|uniref:acetyltransferase n=1 Tax=Crenobacter luteus TaxID=1452487 RepID=UPI001045E426|nr:acetyltransferase [Crenobacter luteus]TCP09425.1 hypothetical protein EV683_12728 [Crenobacter luteus]